MSTVTEVSIPRGVIAEMAQEYRMDPVAFERTLRATVFPAEASKEHFAAFLMVAREYGLNPLTKQIYAFPDKRTGGVIPIVPIDGWMTIINRHPQFDGMEFEDKRDGDKLESITCRIYRKDRAHPTCVTEYLSECARGTESWKQWPARMLRHKSALQCARYAFALSGINDPDEAERILERDVTPPSEQPKPATRTDAIVERLRKPVDAELVERKEPDPITLQIVLGYIEKAPSREVAEEALDLGRSLTAEEHATATAEFNKRWGDTVGASYEPR